MLQNFCSEDNVQDFYNPFINSTYTIDGSKIIENYKNLFAVDGPRIIMKDPKVEFNLKIQFNSVSDETSYITITNEMLEQKGFYTMTNSDGKPNTTCMIVDKYNGENAFMFCLPEQLLTSMIKDAEDGGTIVIYLTGKLGEEDLDEKDALIIQSDDGVSHIKKSNTFTYSPGEKLYTENALRQCLNSFLEQHCVEGFGKLTLENPNSLVTVESLNALISSLESKIEALEGKVQ